MTELSVKELWELQERLWDDPRLEDAIQVVRNFPKPKSNKKMSDEEHLVIILWGMQVESIVSDKLKEMGCDNSFINEHDHKFLAPIPHERMADADLFIKSDDFANMIGSHEADAKGWNGFKSYSHPRWTSPHPTIDFVMRCERHTASIYMTGKRDVWNDPEGTELRAQRVWSFEFKPEDERVFDYKDRMLSCLKAKRALY